MHPEQGSWQRMEIAPKNPETDAEVPKWLKYLHESKREFLSRGVFFDVYELQLPEQVKEAEDSEQDPRSFVLKDFRCGDVTMDPREQVSLLQHQYYEWVILRSKLGEQFFPESFWIRSNAFTEQETEGFLYPNETANTMMEFVKIQLNRQLADRYSSDDAKKGSMKQLMSKIGEVLLSEHTESPYIGSIVQERVHGIPFSEALRRIRPDDPKLATLKQNTQELITSLRMYHGENPYTAFTWHGLDSDNVMVEVDAHGEITGRVVVVDANFTERPIGVWKTQVVNRMEREIFAPLEEALDLPSRG